jgi:PPOX class probable F420-dependent enzyme
LTAFVRRARIGHLATADGKGRPVVVPCCYAFDGAVFYSPLDEKPKRVAPERLRRARNVAENPEVALVVDQYDEDWSRLRFVLVRGRATMLASGREHERALLLLRRKYPQYRSMQLESRPIVKIVPWRFRHWEAAR